MTKEEAENILERYHDLEDVSCSCHINPPCHTCVNMPSQEEVSKAWSVIETEEGYYNE